MASKKSTTKTTSLSERPRIQSSHGHNEGRKDRRKDGDERRTGKKRDAKAEPKPRPVARAQVRPQAGTSADKVTLGRAPAASLASEASRELATAIAMAALDKKAVGLELLDVAGRVDYADFLVLMTGRSDRHVAALAQGIEESLRKASRRPLSVEGLPAANWVLMDFGDVVVHVFQDEARGLYDIEGLWMDARRLPVPMPESHA